MRSALVQMAFAAVALLVPAAARAACDQGLADAKGIAFTVGNMAAGEALAQSILDGFTGEAYLHSEGLRLDAPECAAATFSIGPLQQNVYADDSQIWPRSSTGHGGPGATLMATLRPETAAKAQKVSRIAIAAGGVAFVKVSREDLIYMLAVEGGPNGKWSVYCFYDHIPDTPRLAQVMCQAILGSLPVAAVYDPHDESVTFKDLSALAAFGDVGTNGGPCAVGPAP